MRNEHEQPSQGRLPTWRREVDGVLSDGRDHGCGMINIYYSFSMEIEPKKVNHYHL
jgi:hypothetical protein